MAGSGGTGGYMSSTSVTPTSLVGTLDAMCSPEEITEREQARQLDAFEWRRSSDPKAPEAEPSLATKRYHRSAADRAFRAEEVRTPQACHRTAKFLITEVLDLDRSPKPDKFAVDNVTFSRIYDYLRNRLRAVRVDLQLQGAKVAASPLFMEVHEWCLRFELLALAVLASGAAEEHGANGGGYDESLGLAAMAQTFEPLLAAYRLAREQAPGGPTLASPQEPAMQRLVILLLASHSSPVELAQHLRRLEPFLLRHPTVRYAVDASSAFLSGDYSKVLKLYRGADILTAAAMSGAVADSRVRVLAMLARCGPPRLSDKIPLRRMSKLLAFGADSDRQTNEDMATLVFLQRYGVDVVEAAPSSNEGGMNSAEAAAMVAMPKRGDVSAEGHPLLVGGDLPLPLRAERLRGVLFASRINELDFSRADIVLGHVDPGVTGADCEACSGKL